MEVRNCPKCGKLFTYMSQSVCPDCVKKEEEIFQTLKAYINDNPLCSMSELSEATGISPKIILYYIKENRLEISEGMKGEVKCEHCGKPITLGRFCDACVIKINQELSEMFNEKTDNRKVSAKMHTTPRRL